MKEGKSASTYIASGAWTELRRLDSANRLGGGEIGLTVRVGGGVGYSRDCTLSKQSGAGDRRGIRRT